MGNIIISGKLGDFRVVDKKLDHKISNSAGGLFKLKLGKDQLEGVVDSLFLVFKFGDNSSFSVRGVDTGGIIYFHYWGLTYTVYRVAKSGGIVFIIFCSIIRRTDTLYILCIYTVNTHIRLIENQILDFLSSYSLRLED